MLVLLGKIILRAKKKKFNKKDYIRLNSLFTLPSIGKEINRYNSIKSIFSKNNKNILLTNSNSNIFGNKKGKTKDLINHSKSRLLINKDSKYDNLYSFMKLKYYEDVNERLEKKLRDDSFIDRGVKDKIIKMGKVGIFWKNVFEYCSPLLFEEKYKNMKKVRHNFNQDEEKYNNVNEIYDRKLLYTNMISIKNIHNKRNNRNALNFDYI